MSKGSFEERTERRDRLIGLLRSDDYWTTAKLNQELGISQRTLMRDLAELRASGYPIESDRGRGGGVRLDGRWGIERFHLSHHEIVELILALAVMENLNSPMMSGSLKAIRQKLFQAFPPKQRHIVARIRQRIFVGNQASPHTVSFYASPNSHIAGHVSECFLKQRELHIDYRSENGACTSRVIEAQYVVLNWPMWYVLAWDHLRADVRLFRLDRIEKSQPRTREFKLRPKEEFSNLYAPLFQSI